MVNVTQHAARWPRFKRWMVRPFLFLGNNGISPCGISLWDVTKFCVTFVLVVAFIIGWLGQ